VSTPAASPETTARPASTAVLAARFAMLRPKPVGRRVPTIATASTGGSTPHTHSVFGGEGIERSPAG
jgi:hypothetical protein